MQNKTSAHDQKNCSGILKRVTQEDLHDLTLGYKGKLASSTNFMQIHAIYKTQVLFCYY